jgi:hypothetical protein
MKFLLLGAAGLEGVEVLDDGNLRLLLETAESFFRAGGVISLGAFANLSVTERLILEEARRVVRREERNEDAAVLGMALASEATRAELYASEDGGEMRERLAAKARRARLEQRATTIANALMERALARKPVCEVGA